MMKKHSLSVSLLLLLTLTLTTIWFRHGLLYGGGDVGLPTYNPQRILDITKYIWWEASGPGFPRPQGLTSIPLQSIQSLLDAIGIPFFGIQAILFGSILLLMSFGMYWLGLEIFGFEARKKALIAAVFYLLNPYMMIQVWHRFVHTTFFLAAALPFLFIFWKWWLDEKRITGLILFILTNFIFSFMFGTLAFVITIWILFTLYFVYKITIPWQGLSMVRKMTARLLIGLFAWLLTNTWWLLPVITVGPTTFSVQHTIEENITTLLSISRQSIIPYSIYGINPFYLFDQADWGNIYQNPIFKIIPLFMFGLVILGFLKSLKQKNLTFWGLLFLAAILLAKGAAPPLGYFFVWGFTESFFLGVLRNPFEKLGILIPFTYAILLAVGITEVLQWAVRTKKLTFTLFLVFLTVFLNFAVFLWPMWTGDVFGSQREPVFVQVPNPYKQADEWIKNQKKDGRILHLPLAPGETIRYNWQFGYNGVEPSQLFFSRSSISQGFNLPFLDDALAGISWLLRNASNIEKDKIAKIFGIFNIRYIVLHKDVDWLAIQFDNPTKLEEVLQRFDFVQKKVEFGQLVIYEVDEKIFKPRVFVSSSANSLDQLEKRGAWPWLLAEPTFLSSPNIQDNTKNSIVTENSNSVTVLPERVIELPPFPLAFPENAINELPAIRFLPDSVFYPLIRIKEAATIVNRPVLDRLRIRLDLAGKRLVEAYRLKQIKQEKSIEPTLNEYRKNIYQIIQDIGRRKNSGQIPPEEVLNLQQILSRHIVVLREIIQLTKATEKETANSALMVLRNAVAEIGLIPFFELMKKDEVLEPVDRVVYQFIISKPAKYEVLLARQESDKLYDNLLTNLGLQIDNYPVLRQGKLKGKFISYGEIDFTPGMHEISFNTKVSKNLTPELRHWEKNGTVKEHLNQNEQILEISSQAHDESSIVASIDPFSPDSTYKISFEYWVQKGHGPILEVAQDTDPAYPTKEGGKIRQISRLYEADNYNFYWKHQSIIFVPRPTTSQSLIRFLIQPWNNCLKILTKKSDCKNSEIRKTFDKESVVLIRNVKVQRLLKNPVFLSARLKPPVFTDSSASNDVTYQQVNSVLYKGRVKISQPSFIIFSETFHPGWQLIIKDSKNGETQSAPHFLANLFANGWYVDKTGEYEFVLKFLPQERVFQGVIITAVTWLGILCLGIYLLKKR